MNETQRKTLYSVTTAISAVLVAYGVYSAATGDQIVGVIQAVISLIPTIAGIVAHRNTPTAPGPGEPPTAP